MVSPFTDVFAGFRLRVLAVGAGELAFWDWGSPDLAFLRCLRRAITKADSKVRSLDSPAFAGRMTVGSVVRVVSGGHSPRSWRSWFCSSCNLASAWMRAWRSDSNVAMCRPVLGSYQPSWPSVQRRLRLRMVL